MRTGIRGRGTPRGHFVRDALLALRAPPTSLPAARFTAPPTAQNHNSRTGTGAHQPPRDRRARSGTAYGGWCQ